LEKSSHCTFVGADDEHLVAVILDEAGRGIHVGECLLASSLCAGAAQEALGATGVLATPGEKPDKPGVPPDELTVELRARSAARGRRGEVDGRGRGGGWREGRHGGEGERGRGGMGVEFGERAQQSDTGWALLLAPMCASFPVRPSPRSPLMTQELRPHEHVPVSLLLLAAW